MHPSFSALPLFRRLTGIAFGVLAAALVAPALAAVYIDSDPLSKPNTVPGNLVLVPSVEWPTVVTQANDPGQGDAGAAYTTTSVTTCPTGYTLSGGNCQRTVAAIGSCASPYELSGSSCIQTASPNSTTTYSCPSQFTPSTGITSTTTCSRTKSGSSTFTSSECSNFGTGYTRSNSNRTCSGPSIPSASYSCPSGYQPSSGVTASTTCTQTGAAPTYSCEAGTLSGSNCILSATATTRLVPYVGYFNPALCYAYHYDTTEANRYFYPVSNTTTDGSGNAYSCAGQTGGTPVQKLWSGNYLNWASMQAVDTFRLALTGGHRVHRPADGTPPSVTIKGADGNNVTKSTSEMPDVTYLEKGNSDRWDNSYTKLRQLTNQVANATPSATTSFRSRIAALRNQMWFIPNSAGNLGDAEAYNNPQPIPLPVPDGLQTTTDGDGPALPYDPTYHTLPNADSTTATNTTVCAANEPGCSLSPTPACNSGGTWNGSACATSTNSSSTALLCTNGTYPYFYSSGSTRRCQRSSTNTSSIDISTACANSSNTVGNVTTSTTVSFPSSGSNRSCTLSTTVSTIYPSVPQYTHTIYGRNQIYAASIRVKVCDGNLDTRSFCTRYGNNYKPEGLLQHNAKKIRYSLFSYLTETGQQRDGGVMRARQKLIGPVVTGEKPYPDRSGRIVGIDNPEWDPVTGVFIDNPDTTDTASTNANIGNCSSSAPDGSQCVVKYSGVINYLNRFGQILTGQQTLKSFDNLSEMYYMALRYLRGLANIASYSNLTKSATSDLSGSGVLAKYQNADGLPVIDDWYKTGANTAVTTWNSSTPSRTTGTDGDPLLYQCQTTVMLGIGDTHTNNEDDSDNKTKDGTAPGATWRGYTEFNSGGNGRGNLAGLAYWAHLNDLRADIPNTDVANKTVGSKRGQTISTFWVDVVEQNDLYATNTNQFYNATKYGGYVIPIDDWDINGNAARHDAAWFESNAATWTSETQSVKTVTGLGGTGDYKLPNNMYLANNGQAMIDGLTAAFSKIVEDLAGSGASLAANSTKLDNGTTTYQAVYYTGDWRGDLKAFAVNLQGTIATTATWEASKRLPSPAERNIYTCTGSGICSTSAAFDTSTTFDSKNDLCVNSGACSAGEANTLINYLRGTPASTLRLRSTALGDIINSQPVFVGSPSPNQYSGRDFEPAYRTFANNADVQGRKKTIYVAANDGMLHAFSAEAAAYTATIAGQNRTVTPGQEIFAYLPKAVIKSGVRKLAAGNYGEPDNPHQFWNDGELVVADVQCATANCPNAVNGWATVLVGTTGRGPSKAVYALDVTKPTDVRLMWERSSADGAAGSSYIGQIIGKPVIARVSSAGGWAALMGNGYNSTENVPALLQFDITSGALSVYTTTGSTNDGLAQPAVWISDATLTSNVSTEAYAGDLNGNVWSFSLAASGGGVGSKIFIAKKDSVTQPISAGMIVGKNPKNGQVWVFFGTGAFLSSFQRTDGLQTWYGLIVQGTDKVGCSEGTCTPRSELKERTIVAESAATATSLAARAISGQPDVNGDGVPDNDMVGKKGWFIDLKVVGGTNTGERMVTPNQFQGSLLIGTSRLPTSGDPCNPSGSGWIMAIDPFSGAPPTTSFFDVNDSGSFTDDTVTATDGTQYVAAGVGFGAIPNNPIFVSHTMLISFDNAETGSLNTRPGGSGTAARLSWRELVGQ